MLSLVDMAVSIVVMMMAGHHDLSTVVAPLVCSTGEEAQGDSAQLWTGQVPGQED